SRQSSCRDSWRGADSRQCKDFLPTVDSANGRWPTNVTLAVGFSRSGSAWLGRSQKDGLPSAVRGRIETGSRPSTRAREGQPARCPFLMQQLSFAAPFLRSSSELVRGASLKWARCL